MALYQPVLMSLYNTAERVAPTRWRENRAPHRRLVRLNLPELWAYRELVVILALRDLKVRYKQTALGVAWAVLQPLVGVLIFSIVFGHLAHLPSDGVPYPVFVYAGLAVWTYFAATVAAGADSLVVNRALVTKAYFPRLVAPAAAVLPGLVDLAISLVILGVFMAGYGVAPSAAILLLPFLAVALVVVAFAASLWLSALNALYRDVRYALGFLIQVWFFASPVVFPTSLITDGWRYLFAVNPIVGLIDTFRWSLLDAPPPAAYDLVSAASGVLLLISGAVYFRAAEHRFADRI